MRIGIDCRTALARKTGDRTYTLNLLRGLASLDLDPARWQFDLLLDKADEDGILPRAAIFRPLVLTAPNSRLWTLWALPRYARQARLDLVHLHYLAPSLPCPFVSTIHDVVWRAMPRTFPRLHREIMRRAMPSTARRAARILTVSHAAKRDIVRFLHAPAGKIDVTYNAVEPRFGEVEPARIAQIRAKYHIGSAPYVLSVGVLQPRKNVPRLMHAFERIAPKFPDHRLVIVGKEGWGGTSSLTPHPASFTFTGYVPDEDLPALYGGATVFAYPSLYEGFGLPIVEAMACGCAVLTSDRGAVSEVAGNAARKVDPYSVEAIAEGLSGLLIDEGQRAQLMQHGRERATLFTPQRQAQATLEAYEHALPTS